MNADVDPLDGEGDADAVLATYGTLAPGRVNHHRLAGLTGAWTKGKVRGRLVHAGWGDALGYPGLVIDPNGPDVVEVDLFRSPDLPAFWPTLDAFEGDGYRRIPVSVVTQDGVIKASLYEVTA